MFHLYSVTVSKLIQDREFWLDNLSPELGVKAHNFIFVITKLYGANGLIQNSNKTPKIVSIILSTRKHLLRLIHAKDYTPELYDDNLPQGYVKWNIENFIEWLGQMLFDLALVNKRHYDLYEKFFDAKLAIAGLLRINRNSLGKIRVLKST